MYDWAARSRKSWARFNFYVYAWPFYIDSDYFIYAPMIYVCTHVKIKRQWKSTLKCKQYVIEKM